MIGEKEIFWESVNRNRFQHLLNCSMKQDSIVVSGLGFKSHPLKINIAYDNPSFRGLLEEKFILYDSLPGFPVLYFLKYDPSFGFSLPSKHYGYVSDNGDALIFASSFGVFKSVISGFASFLVSKYGYVPVHGSVFEVDGNGIILTGGTKAGKTTALINLVSPLILEGRNVKILTDDWAIVRGKGSSYTIETFDPSISLREINLIENPHLKFHEHRKLVESIEKRIKVSLDPDSLYGMSLTTNSVSLKVVVLLRPEIGNEDLQLIDRKDFALEIVDAAYHYPYVLDNHIYQHRVFWEKISSEIETFSFFTRTKEGGFQDLTAIRRLL